MVLDNLSKKRYELIPERFSPAIHGLRNFLEAHPPDRYSNSVE